jgi:hypothetical protein
MVGDVLEKAPLGLALADNACNVWPQMPWVLIGSLASSDAEGLARIASRDAIHCSTPACAVECSHVRPDRRRIQPSCFHMRDKEARDIGFPLDSTNQLCCWFGKLEAKLKPARSGT